MRRCKIIMNYEYRKEICRAFSIIRATRDDDSWRQCGRRRPQNMYRPNLVNRERTRVGNGKIARQASDEQFSRCYKSSERTQIILKEFALGRSGEFNRWVQINPEMLYRDKVFPIGTRIWFWICIAMKIVASGFWQTLGDINKGGRNFCAGKTYVPAEIGLVKAVRVRLRSFVRTIKNYDFKEILPKSTMYSIAISLALAQFRSLQSSKVYEDFGKTFIKVVRQLAERERGDAMCVCALGVSPYDASPSLSQSSARCALFASQKIIECVSFGKQIKHSLDSG